MKIRIRWLYKLALTTRGITAKKERKKNTKMISSKTQVISYSSYTSSYLN